MGGREFDIFYNNYSFGNENSKNEDLNIWLTKNREMTPKKRWKLERQFIASRFQMRTSNNEFEIEINSGFIQYASS